MACLPFIRHRQPVALVFSRMNRSAIESRMMRSRSAPWWMYLVAAAFVTLFGLFLYVTVRGPANVDPADFNIVFIDGGSLVQTIADSQLRVAGLQTGDRVIRVDGYPVQNVRQWLAEDA